MTNEDSLGLYLRKMREAQGKTLAEIAEETKINCRYLEALEKEAWGELPAEVYIQGYLRAYALALGLDPEDILRRYREVRPRERASEEILRDQREIKRFWPWIIFFSLVILIVLFLVFR